MSKAKKLPIVLAAIPFLVSVALFTRLQSASDSSPKNRELQVVNKTASLDVTAWLGVDKQLHNLPQLFIKFTNVSTRACTGYAISFGDGHTGVRWDLDDPQYRLQLGQSRTQKLHPSEVVTEDGALKLINIETGLFADDTIEGNETTGIRMLDDRFGEAIQLAKFRASFENILDSPDESLSEAIAKLESEVDALPTSYDESSGGRIGDNVLRRNQVETGMKNGKQLLRHQIESLKQVPRWKPNAPLSDTEKQAMISIAKRDTLTKISGKCKSAADHLERSRLRYPSEKVK